MKKKKMILYSLISILSLSILLGVSYAYMQLSIPGAKKLVVKTGVLELTLNEGEAITLNSAYPVNDQIGMTHSPATFSIKNTGQLHSNYRIYLEDQALENSEERLPDEVLKFNLSKNGATIKSGRLSDIEVDGLNLLDQGLLKIGAMHQYELRIWVDENTTSEHMGKTFSARLKIVADQLVESLEQTPEFCFGFNTSTGTITSYDSSCPKNVIIPEQISGVTVKAIGNYAFQAQGLTSISIPSTVVSILNYAFHLNQLPDDQAFIYKRNADGSIDNTVLLQYGGGKKENVKIPDTVTTISDFAFHDCEIKSVIFPEGLKKIGTRAFTNNRLETLNIPDSVTTIGGGAFSANRLPDDQAFIYNRNADGTVNYSSLNSYGGSKQSNVVIPSNIKILGNNSFILNRLGNMVIPEGVTRIEGGAFENAGLTSITIPSTVNYIAGGSFKMNSLPDDQAFIYKRNADGSIDETTLVSYGGKNKGNVIVPENVTTLANGSFYWDDITKLTLPTHLEKIATNAIGYLQITSLTIPSSVKTIESQALIGNSKLRTIINQTGNSFNWQAITGGKGAATFVTGIIPHANGNITVLDHE